MCPEPAGTGWWCSLVPVICLVLLGQSFGGEEGALLQLYGQMLCHEQQHLEGLHPTLFKIIPPRTPRGHCLGFQQEDLRLSTTEHLSLFI